MLEGRLKSQEDIMQIGEIARRSGFNVYTLRYYEKIGLLPRIGRDESGRRRYNADDLARLAFIRRAQKLKLSLEEIGQLLALRDQPEVARGEAQELCERKLNEITIQLDELQTLKTELAALLGRCQASAEHCPILDHMAQDVAP